MCESDPKSGSQTPHKHWVAILITLSCVSVLQHTGKCGFLAVFRYYKIKDFRSFWGFAPRTPPGLCPGPDMGLKAPAEPYLYLMAPSAAFQFLQLWKVLEKLINCPGNVLEKSLKMCSKFCMNPDFRSSV